MSGWDNFCLAQKAYGENASPETFRALVDAYRSWGIEFNIPELNSEVERFRKALMAEQRKRAA